MSTTIQVFMKKLVTDNRAERLMQHHVDNGFNTMIVPNPKLDKNVKQGPSLRWNHAAEKQVQLVFDKRVMDTRNTCNGKRIATLPYGYQSELQSMLEDM